MRGEYREWPTAPSVDVLGDLRDAMQYTPDEIIPRGPNRPARMGLRRRGLRQEGFMDSFSGKGPLNYNLSDLLSQGGATDKDGNIRARVTVDADPDIQRRIDRLTQQVKRANATAERAVEEIAEARAATERTGQIVIVAAALVTTVVVIAKLRG